MEDERIVELFWERSEEAIKETKSKYGSYCRRIAFNILANDQDAEECENDTYLRAWEAMPPHRPTRLASFLGRITRNVALNRYAHDRAQKRAPGIEVVYEELSDLISDDREGDDETALAEAISGFLSTLPKEARIVFVQRYWYFCPVKVIAQSRGLSESNVKVTLMRTRKKFKEYLEKEGITV